MFPRALPLVALLLACWAGAYPEVLFATVTTQPPVPQPEAPFTFTVQVGNAADEPVRGLDLLIELQGLETQGDETGSALADSPTDTELPLGELLPGTYLAEVGGMPQGEYRLALVEDTGAGPPAAASGVMSLDGESPAQLELVLPADERGLGGWVVWLVGIPLLAGLLVTLLLLTGRRHTEERLRSGANRAAEGDADRSPARAGDAGGAGADESGRRGSGGSAGATPEEDAEP